MHKHDAFNTNTKLAICVIAWFVGNGHARFQWRGIQRCHENTCVSDQKVLLVKQMWGEVKATYLYACRCREDLHEHSSNVLCHAQFRALSENSFNIWKVQKKNKDEYR